MTLYNLLEPPNLIERFRAYPPEGFTPLGLDCGAPAFSTRFDLLTTAPPAVRRTLGALSPFLRPATYFVGTTVSEYALFPSDAPPERLVSDLMAAAAQYPFVIIKDIPTEATLVGDDALAYSRRLAEACRGNGFVLVEGQALAYVPIDFASTGEYLRRLSHARRRNLRRKLRSRAALQVDEIATGDARFRDEGFLAAMYALYLNVYRQSDVHFDLLSAPFFRALLQDESLNGQVLVYRAAGELIGTNIRLMSGGMLIDKYVGFLYPQARDHDLYAVSWFDNLECALARGLRCYVAGWTDPEIKRSLGARFTFTQHAVYVRNPLLRGLLRTCRRFFESDHQWQAHASSTSTAR
jgi:predicted N-acyltransferase